jgi:indolepyruvate decarboxylase
MPGDILIAGPGTAAVALPTVLLPDGVDYHSQTLWGCVGWATPAAFGAAVADPSRRVILVEGDGGHQLTANEIGVMGRYGVNLIILLLNNGIFGIEEILQGNSNRDNVHIYDKIAPWQYHKLPEAMGCRDWFCTSVETNAELESALRKARKHPGAAYIEILLGPKMVAAAPPELIDRVYQAETPTIATIDI